MIKIELDNVCWGVNEAAKAWGLKPMYIKNMCAAGKVKAVKIGKTWIIDNRQPNPARKAVQAINA
jgi:hypothetical protein